MRNLMLFTLPILFMSATAEGGAGGGGGGGGTAAPPAAPGGQQQAAAPAGQAPKDAPPSGDQEEKIPLTRKELDAKLADRADRASKRAREELIAKFKDDGITNEEELEKAIKAYKAAQESQKSELQKANEKASRAEKDAEAAKADAAAAREEARRVRVFTAAGVKDADYVGFLLDKAKVENKDLNEKDWLDQLKKDKPVLFGQSEEPPRANSGRKEPGVETRAGNGNGKGDEADLSKLSPEERRKRAIADGINPRLIGA